MSEIIITKKIKTEFLEGHIKIKALTYPERIVHSKKSMTSVSDSEKTLQYVATESLDRAQEYYELAKAKITEMQIKINHDEYGGEVSNIDELILYEEGNNVIMDIAKELIAGISLGNGKQRPLEETVQQSSTDSQITSTAN
jgi:hypothetical protein